MQRHRHLPHTNPSILVCLIVLTCFGCFIKRPVDYEREYAKTLAPKRMEMTTTPAATGPRRTLRVRVYADADYRAQVLHWERAIEVQLQRATSAVEEPLGVRFSLESTRLWNREAAPELDDALVQLETLDRGEDVDLVIGLVSALPLFSSTQHQLGLARMLGRHCVLRGMDNLEESNALRSAFQNLPLNEREELYRERKLHKETSVLLHEWAHTLGAFHVGDSRWMMHPSYDPAQGSFAPQTLELLALSLRHLPLARRNPDEQRRWAQDLQTFLTQTVWPEWEGPEKAEIMAWTEGVLAGVAPSAPQRAVPMPPADRQRLEEAIALEQQGSVELSMQKLKPLVPHYPLDERVQVLACYLAVRTAPKDPVSRERCDVALTHFPNQLTLLLSAALVRLQNDHPEEAPPFLLKARQQLEALPTTPPEQWANLAALFQGASCISWAEQASQRATGTAKAAQVLAWATQLRRWAALPADAQKSGVTIEQEGPFLRTVMEFEALMGSRLIAGAQKKLNALAKAYPAAPAVQVLECELKTHVGELPAAKASCQKALARDDEAAHAHFLLGWIASASGAGKEARMHLERVIALVPSQGEAWRLLEEQYRRAGKKQELNDLRERYQKQVAQTQE